MCNFECIYERGGLCILDNESCFDGCDHNEGCRYCDTKCREEDDEEI